MNVESGSGLLAMDAGETSDPYVKVSLVNGAGLAVDGQVHRTGYRPKTTQSGVERVVLHGQRKTEISRTAR